MKIISAGTPYLLKNPWSLAIQSGSTLALTAAWAITLLAGAAAASAFSGIKNSARTMKKIIVHLSTVDSFSGYSSRATGDTEPLATSSKP
jgi:hypothetical protein